MPNNIRLKYNLNTIQNFQHAIKIEVFTKKNAKKNIECELNCKKNPKNIYYMSSLSSTWPRNHSNNKFKQKHLKVPEGPELSRKQ